MTFIRSEDSPRPRVGVKPPPGGAVGGCPVRCATRTVRCDTSSAVRANRAGADGQGVAI